MKFLRELFDDNNSINEKAVVGFIAFFMLCVSLVVDLITGYFGKPLVINEFIFDGFMVIILGAFGIASVDKWLNKKDKKDTMQIEQENNQNTEKK
jgi:ABC-type uncharacterized transport system permease subunit